MAQDVGRLARGGVEARLDEEHHQWQQQQWIEAGEGGGECGPRIEGSQSGTRGIAQEGLVEGQVLQVW